MTIIFCVTKEDINTHKVGNNYSIATQSGININFTKEAIEELYNDMLGLDEIGKAPNPDESIGFPYKREEAYVGNPDTKGVIWNPSDKTVIGL
jgi:hypothetical protein